MASDAADLLPVHSGASTPLGASARRLGEAEKLVLATQNPALSNASNANGTGSGSAGITQTDTVILLIQSHLTRYRAHTDCITAAANSEEDFATRQLLLSIVNGLRGITDGGAGRPVSLAARLNRAQTARSSPETSAPGSEQDTLWQVEFDLDNEDASIPWINEDGDMLQVITDYALGRFRSDDRRAWMALMSARGCSMRDTSPHTCRVDGEQAAHVVGAFQVVCSICEHFKDND